MAIWQYQLFIIPKEEINSYFENSEYIEKAALDEINWWKFRAFEKVEFESFRKVLKQKKSWSQEILLFGEEESNCFEVLFKSNKIIEVLARIDLRTDYYCFLDNLCAFTSL